MVIATAFLALQTATASDCSGKSMIFVLCLRYRPVIFR